MFRTKPDTYGSSDHVGIVNNKKFTLRINVSEGGDEDFIYFNEDGFSYIPYKTTTPIIGGTSNTSLYYKTIDTQLKFIQSDSDALKSEIAIAKMDASKEGSLPLLDAFQIPRYDITGSLVYSGILSSFGELGDGVDNMDLSDVKVFNKPKQLYEMFGFSDPNVTEVNKPDEPRYWKNIIPQDYSIFNRNGLSRGVSWKGGSFPVVAANWNVLIKQNDIDGFDMTSFPRTGQGFVDAWLEADIYLTNINWYPRWIEITDAYTVSDFGYSEENRMGFRKTIPLSSLNGGSEIDEAGNTRGRWKLGKNTIKLYLGNNSDGGEIVYMDMGDPLQGYATRTVDKYGLDYSTERGYRDSYNFNRIQIGRTSDCNNDAGAFVGAGTDSWPCTGSPNDVIDIRNFRIYHIDSKVNRKSKQEWVDGYYYPVLPRYDINGKFIDNNYPNNNLPFPDDGPITNKDNNIDSSLILHIGNKTIDRGVLDDLSENTNYGFVISDYKPSLKNNVKKKVVDSIRKSTDGGAF